MRSARAISAPRRLGSMAPMTLAVGLAVAGFHDRVAGAGEEAVTHIPPASVNLWRCRPVEQYLDASDVAGPIGAAHGVARSRDDDRFGSLQHTPVLRLELQPPHWLAQLPVH